MQSHSQSVPSAALPLHAPALSSLKSGLSRSPGGWSDGLRCAGLNNASRITGNKYWLISVGEFMP
jgi:hypothetical protein